MTRQAVIAVLVVWLLVAFAIGAAGVLRGLPLPPPILALVLSLLVLTAIRRSRAARNCVQALGVKSLVTFHAVRIVAGGYFLFLYQRGRLPGEFAIPAGWGDIVVGVAALVVAQTCLPVTTSRRRTGLLVWNVIGLVDILGVLFNGARILLGNAAFGTAFMTLPLVLLPTFVVPLVIVSHVLLFAWTRVRPAERSMR